jgi:signal transduction histidine kinase
MLTWFFGKKSTAPSSEKRKDDFVSLSSHELRAPLSIIKWYTEILLDGDAGPLTDDQRKYLTVIETSNQRAIDLVRSLLNVSRLDLGTFSISPSDISLNDAMTEAVSLLTKESEKKHITILQEKGDIPELQADKHLCVTFTKHLLLNAIVFSPDNGTVELATSRVSAGTNVGGELVTENSIIITVKDNGCGIPEKDGNKIFTKMFKGSNVQETENTGSGLGLYIVKSIIEQTGGKIWFISQVGVGSTFFVALPLKGMKKKEGRTTLD